MERNYKPQCTAPREAEQLGARKAFKRQGNSHNTTFGARKSYGDFAAWFTYQSQRF